LELSSALAAALDAERSRPDGSSSAVCVLRLPLGTRKNIIRHFMNPYVVRKNDAAPKKYKVFPRSFFGDFLRFIKRLYRRRRPCTMRNAVVLGIFSDLNYRARHSKKKRLISCWAK